MADIKIITNFDKLYELLKPEFNSGSISVVGSVLNHITGFNTKTDDSGDINLILNSTEAEIALITIARELGDNIEIIYEPNSTESISINFDGNFIKTSRFDPKSGTLENIICESKTYILYKQKMEDQLNSTFDIVIETYNKLNSKIRIYTFNSAYMPINTIRDTIHIIDKQINNIDIYVKNAGLIIEDLSNYQKYNEALASYKSLDVSMFIE